MELDWRSIHFWSDLTLMDMVMTSTKMFMFAMPLSTKTVLNVHYASSIMTSLGVHRWTYSLPKIVLCNEIYLKD